MEKLSSIEAAIKDRLLISFTYARTGKAPGLRIGAPHAVFIRQKKDGTKNVYLHLYQTGGATDSAQELPSWRQFFVNDLDQVQLLRDEAPFEIAPGYNATSYEFPIAKV